LADITVDDAYATIMDVRTSGAGIQGGFAGRYVNMETTFWPISTNITLLAPFEEERTSRLFMSNHDALVSSSIVLADNPEGRSIPRYQVSLVDIGDATLGQLDVKIRSQRPPGSTANPPPLRPYTLDLSATSKASPVTIAVDPWFEGQFNLHAESEWAEAVIEGEEEHVLDPAGMGRSRNIQLTKSEASSVEGSVAWEVASSFENDADVGVGRLLVRTSQGKARLLL